jgi:hypothetical protein|nr:MAG TPA: hypothetical protein [Caudoviricetes sp.]DAW42882.1 MAG TPA: hypothetical protein [Caudoviricetes sp.]
MDLKDGFVDLINETMNEEDHVEISVSMVEDLAIDEDIYNGSYLEEQLDNLFPTEITDPVLLEKLGD